MERRTRAGLFNPKVRAVVKFIQSMAESRFSTQARTLEPGRSSCKGGIVAEVVVREMQWHEKPPKIIPVGLEAIVPLRGPGGRRFSKHF